MSQHNQLYSNVCQQFGELFRHSLKDSNVVVRLAIDLLFEASTSAEPLDPVSTFRLQRMVDALAMKSEAKNPVFDPKKAASELLSLCGFERDAKQGRFTVSLPNGMSVLECLEYGDRISEQLGIPANYSCKDSRYLRGVLNFPQEQWGLKQQFPLPHMYATIEIGEFNMTRKEQLADFSGAHIGVAALAQMCEHLASKGKRSIFPQISEDLDSTSVRCHQRDLLLVFDHTINKLSLHFPTGQQSLFDEERYPAIGAAHLVGQGVKSEHR